jgi:hypothetical protein
VLSVKVSCDCCRLEKILFWSSDTCTTVAVQGGTGFAPRLA